MNTTFKHIAAILVITIGASASIGASAKGSANKESTRERAVRDFDGATDRGSKDAREGRPVQSLREYGKALDAIGDM